MPVRFGARSPSDGHFFLSRFAPSSTRSAAMNASCGTSTRPTRRIRALPFFCCLEELALARDVAAVALRRDVLALGLHGLARDDLRADRGLDRHVEQLARDQLLQAFDHLLAVGVGLVAVHDRAERVDRLAVQQHVDADEVRLLVAPRLVVEARVPARARLQLVEEVEHDLGADYFEPGCPSALDPRVRILHHQRRRYSQQLGRLQIWIRRGLVPGDVASADQRAEAVANPGGLQHRLDFDAVARRHHRQPVACQRVQHFAAVGREWQLAAHQIDEHGSLARQEGQELVEGGPVCGAVAEVLQHESRGDANVSVTVGFPVDLDAKWGHQLAPATEMDRLAVDEDSVEIEQHRFE